MRVLLSHRKQQQQHQTTDEPNEVTDELIDNTFSPSNTQAQTHKPVTLPFIPVNTSTDSVDTLSRTKSKKSNSRGFGKEIEKKKKSSDPQIIKTSERIDEPFVDPSPKFDAFNCSVKISTIAASNTNSPKLEIGHQWKDNIVTENDISKKHCVETSCFTDKPAVKEFEVAEKTPIFEGKTSIHQQALGQVEVASKSDQPSLPFAKKRKHSILLPCKEQNYKCFELREKNMPHKLRREVLTNTMTLPKTLTDHEKIQKTKQDIDYGAKMRPITKIKEHLEGVNCHDHSNGNETPEGVLYLSHSSKSSSSTTTWTPDKSCILGRNPIEKERCARTFNSDHVNRRTYESLSKDANEVLQTQIVSHDVGENIDIQPEEDPAAYSTLHESDSPKKSSSKCSSSRALARKATGRLASSNQSIQEEQFTEDLKTKGLEMVVVEGDGNCLFRAVSLQIFGDTESHMDVRLRCLDFMAKNEDHFSQFVVDEPFQEYLSRKRFGGVHGNNPELQAISELYNRPIEVFVPEDGATPINIFHAEYKTSDAPIRLSYHDGNHYNAVVDPLCPTAGLGLGLPGLEPGLADKMQMQRAFEESDYMHVNHAIQESERSADYIYQKKALAMSDLEATDIELERAVIASSLESYMKNESGMKILSDERRSNTKADSLSTNRSACNSFYHYSNYNPKKSNSSPSFQTNLDRDSSSSSSFDATPQSAPLHASASARSRSCSSFATSASTTDDVGENQDEYPQSVQELVMNGFDLTKVLKAFDLVGDNFDDLLSFLLNSG
mmetsp:Transcript_18838/g.26521  ORF Transcript_18838/g.26521 Transcript_18838/m.26521 type:complete len:779 (-) Transcript_18838:102-2438(-)